MIELKGIAAGYGTHRVLEDVSAVFETGRLTGVIGVNGSGKSTLLKTVLSMLPLQKGEITLDGVSSARLSRRELARKAAYLPQSRSIPDMTVEQLVLHGRFPHLSYPRRYTANDRLLAQAAMEKAGVAEHAQKLLGTLSGGMRQNACIAMALAQGADYLLLDEPLTYLDIRHQLELMKTLRSLADSGKGVVAVMHDLPMAFTYADRLLLLDGGRLLCGGTPAELCRQAALQEVFGVQLELSPESGTYHYRF